MFPWVHLYHRAPFAARPLLIPAISRLMRSSFEGAVTGPVDIVHGMRTGREFLPVAARNYARKQSVPYVITALLHHDWHGPRHAPFDRLYRSADGVIALTDFEKEFLVERKGVAEDRVHVTGLGPVLAESYDVTAFRARHGIERPYILFLGRKVDHKGWGAILDAAPQIFAQFPDLEIVFMGPDTPASTARFKATTNSRIRNLGCLDLEEKTAALADCELFCMPSYGEAFGIVYTEAWQLKKPVIGGDTATLRSIITDGVDGLLSSHDPGQLAERVTWLLSHEAEAKRMGEAGLQKMEKRYTWQRIADATAAAYMSATKSH